MLYFPDMRYILLILSVVGLCYGQGRLVEWTYEDFPNPRVDPAACGRYRNKTSNVCDPNGVISVESGLVILN